MTVVPAPDVDVGPPIPCRPPGRRGTPRPGAPRSRARVRHRTVLPLVDGAAVLAGAVVTGLPVWLAAGYTALSALALAVDGAYRPRITTHVGTRVPRLAAAVAVPLPGLVLLAHPVGRAVVAVAVAVGLLATARAAAGVGTRARRRRRPGEPTLVVGDGPTARRLVTAMREHPELGLAPVDPATPATRVIVADEPDGPDEGAERDVELRHLRERGVPVWVVPRYATSGLAVPTGHLDDLWGTPLIALRPVPADRAVGPRVRRAVDVALAAVLFVVTAPVVAAVAALNRLGGPAFYRQLRLSRHGAVVPVVKIRTVPVGTAETWAVAPGQCTRWGRTLRRTHLDELPQLVSVLRGHLALIGPRPERPVYAAAFAATVPGYAHRLRVRAGITGWAQVHGLCGDTSMPDRARFDRHYVEYRSAWLDAVIVLRTLLALPAAPADPHDPVRPADPADSADPAPGGSS